MTAESGTPRAPVEFWFDFISPYAYPGSTQIESVAARHGRAVDWHPVLIGVTVMQVMGMKPLLELGRRPAAPSGALARQGAPGRMRPH